MEVATNLKKTDRYKEKAQQHQKRYYQQNIKKYQARWKEYYQKNRDYLIKKQKTYVKENKEKVSQKDARHGHRRRSAIKELPVLLTLEQWNMCLNYFGNKCAYCGVSTGDMTQDHFVPLSRKGEYTINNIIPACRSCNSSKSNKDFFSWYPAQPFYSKQYEKNILKYLGYNKNKQQLALF